MNFGKRKRAPQGRQGQGDAESGQDGSQPALMRLEFDMLLKGNVYDRPEGKVRQYGVTVDGATRVVTSGDMIDRDTFQALVSVGAIRPSSKKPDK